MVYLLFFLQFWAYCTATERPLAAGQLDFSNWNQVLEDLVKPGTKDSIALNLFNYSGLVGNPYYDKFTEQVENADVSGFDETEFKAFWINVYNYLAIRIVYEHTCATDLFGTCKPIQSIRQIGEQQPSFFLDTVWDIPYLTIKGLPANLSLNDIEHKRLRTPYNTNPNWKEDPRIHACIVCASVSCPNLKNKAYEVDTLEQDIQDSVRDFLQNEKKGAAVVGNGLQISMIFNWFSPDFNNQTGKPGNTTSISLQWFLIEYGPSAVAQLLKENPTAPISFFSYNWDLNGSVDSLCASNRICVPWWSLVAAGIGAGILLITIVLCVKMNRPRKSDYSIVNS